MQKQAKTNHSHIQHPSDVSSLNNSLEIRQKYGGNYSQVKKTASCFLSTNIKPNDQPDMLRSCWLLFLWGMWVHHEAGNIPTWSTLHSLGLEWIAKTCRTMEWPLNGKPKSVTHTNWEHFLASLFLKNDPTPRYDNFLLKTTMQNSLGYSEWLPRCCYMADKIVREVASSVAWCTGATVASRG